MRTWVRLTAWARASRLGRTTLATRLGAGADLDLGAEEGAEPPPLATLVPGEAFTLIPDLTLGGATTTDARRPPRRTERTRADLRTGAALGASGSVPPALPESPGLVLPPELPPPSPSITGWGGGGAG